MPLIHYIRNRCISQGFYRVNEGYLVFGFLPVWLRSQEGEIPCVGIRRSLLRVDRKSQLTGIFTRNLYSVNFCLVITVIV